LYAALLPSQVRGLIFSSTEAEELLSEYDSASHYLTQVASELQSRISARRRTGRAGESASGSSNGGKIVTVDTSRDFEVVGCGVERRRKKGLAVSAEKWIMLYDSEGRVTISKKEAMEMVFYAVGLSIFIFLFIIIATCW
jgi:hypothetical protein